MSPELQTAVISGVGALASEFVLIRPILRERGWPERFSRTSFWAGLTGWIALAGFVAWLQAPLPRLIAFQLGFSLELVLRRLGDRLPSEPSPDTPVN